MKIAVKSVKVLKTGTNQYGDWKLVKVYTDEGIEYTTLAEEADQIPGGSTINITDMDEDEKGKKFKKFEIIVMGNVPPSSGGGNLPPGGGNAGMTNEMWDQKQRVERDSIEAQTRAERITELWIASKIMETDSLVTKLRAWLELLGGSKPAAALVSAPTETKGKVPPLQALGELYTRAGKFGLSPRDVCEAVEVGKREDIIDFDEAWVATAKKFASTIKAVQEANK